MPAARPLVPDSPPHRGPGRAAGHPGPHFQKSRSKAKASRAACQVPSQGQGLQSQLLIDRVRPETAPIEATRHLLDHCMRRDMFYGESGSLGSDAKARGRDHMDLEFQRLDEQGFVKFSVASGVTQTLEIARSIGDVALLPGIAEVQTLTPKQAEMTEKSSYSGNFGTGPFPLHTDMAHWHTPPRYFLLRCVRPAEGVYTTFLHARKLFHAEADDTMNRSLFRPRRRIDGRLTILRLNSGGMYRWDSLFIQPINDRAEALRQRIAQRIDVCSPLHVALEESNECIVVDNWKTLHGRTAVPPQCMSRRLDRVYLSNITR